MSIPAPRGPWSELTSRCLADPGRPRELPDEVGDVWGDDAQLALWTAYEVHYAPPAVHNWSDDVQDDPTLAQVRQRLARALEQTLRSDHDDWVGTAPAPGVEPGDTFLALVDDLGSRLEAELSGGASVSRFVQREAEREQVLELLTQRSLFALRETDPQAFVLPRLRGAAKAALAELLYDEFGAGRPDRVHADLYVEAMAAAGLDPALHAYVDDASAATLATNNVMSLLCLSTRLATAAAGHFAAFEATSSVGSRRMASGIERVGLPEATAAYFHEHVLADSVHEQVATRDLCGGLLADDPAHWSEIVFGAFCCIYTDARAARDQLERWDALAPDDTEAVGA